jgi:hypothetical protein
MRLEHPSIFVALVVIISRRCRLCRPVMVVMVMMVVVGRRLM